MARARRLGAGVRILAPDEQALWDAVTRDMRRLHGARRAQSITALETAAATLAAAVPAKPSPRAAAAPQPPITLPRIEPLSVDRRSAQKLRRGQLAIDGRLDLHGMTQDEAYHALAGFITASVRHRHKYLLIITGKGSFRTLRDGRLFETPTGVLRDQLPKWLAAPGLRRHIQAIQSAARHHGGDGAFYVLLRRERPKTPETPE